MAQTTESHHASQLPEVGLQSHLHFFLYTYCSKRDTEVTGTPEQTELALMGDVWYSRRKTGRLTVPPVRITDGECFT